MAPRQKLPNDDGGGKGVRGGCRNLAAQMLRREVPRSADIARRGVAVPRRAPVREDGEVHVDEQGAECEDGVHVKVLTNDQVLRYNISVTFASRTP